MVIGLLQITVSTSWAYCLITHIVSFLQWNCIVWVMMYATAILSVCLSISFVSCVETTERIRLVFGTEAGYPRPNWHCFIREFHSHNWDPNFCLLFFWLFLPAVGVVSIVQWTLVAHNSKHPSSCIAAVLDHHNRDNNYDSYKDFCY